MGETEQMESASVRIVVTPTTWSRLNARRNPGQTFNVVIVDLLDRAEGKA